MCRWVICIRTTLKHSYMLGARTRCCSPYVTSDVLSHQPILYKRNGTSTTECTKFEEIVFTLKAYQPASRLLMCITFTAPICTRARWPSTSTNTLIPSLYRSLFIGSIARARYTFVGVSNGGYREMGSCVI